MSSFLYLNYPSWIKPEVIPGIPALGFLRWYGLMYVFAFAFAYYILFKQYKEGALDSKGIKTTEDDILSFISTGFIFLLIGARIFACLIYTPSGKYWKQPWLIFWPFDENMNFTGLAGMSYHGGFIGGFIGMLVWCKKHKRPFYKWMDVMAIAIPCGYTFGRLGNFLNGELYGRLTTMPWGMIFPNAPGFSASLPWVQDFAQSIGMSIPETGVVNLPRHPSQLYEALFEGLILFLAMWFLRKKKPFDGFMSAFYIVGYGLVRFIIEYFRMPDEDMGFKLGSTGAPLDRDVSLLNISTGQILCFLMIVFGIGLGIYCYIKSKKNKECKE